MVELFLLHGSFVLQYASDWVRQIVHLSILHFVHAWLELCHCSNLILNMWIGRAVSSEPCLHGFLYYSIRRWIYVSLLERVLADFAVRRIACVALNLYRLKLLELFVCHGSFVLRYTSNEYQVAATGVRCLLACQTLCMCVTNCLYPWARAINQPETWPWCWWCATTGFYTNWNCWTVHPAWFFCTTVYIKFNTFAFVLSIVQFMSKTKTQTSHFQPKP